MSRMPRTKGELDVLNKRLRQITVHGFTAEHDAKLPHGHLTDMALDLIETYGFLAKRRKALVNAAALLIAEIDRMDREQEDKRAVERAKFDNNP